MSTLIPNALDRMPEIAARMRPRRPAVFLDYDGTLTPIVDRPEEAWMNEDVRALVSRLAELCPVAVVSGRDLPDVRARVGLDVYYAGSHGFDIAGPGGLYHAHPEAVATEPELDAAERELRQALARIAGARVERKRFSIATHYRLVRSPEVAAVERAVNAVRGRHACLRRGRGKKVIELLPDLDWDKGAAVLWLLHRLELDAADVLPIYVGDDLTDERAFRALVTRGLGVVVREKPRPTLARYRLRDTAEVRGFLATIVGLLAHARRSTAAPRRP
jgi:trehalose 6-phosphate phosphatase